MIWTQLARTTETAERTGYGIDVGYHARKTTGTVKRKITGDTTAGGRKVRASEDEPQYLVESDNGNEAVHKPDALTKD